MNFYNKIISKDKEAVYDVFCNLFPTIINIEPNYMNGAFNKTIKLNSLAFLMGALNDEELSDIESKRVIDYINDNFFSNRQLLFEGRCSRHKIDKDKTLGLNLLTIFWNGYVNSIVKTINS